MCICQLIYCSCLKFVHKFWCFDQIYLTLLFIFVLGSEHRALCMLNESSTMCPQIIILCKYTPITVLKLVLFVRTPDSLVSLSCVQSCQCNYGIPENSWLSAFSNTYLKNLGGNHWLGSPVWSLGILLSLFWVPFRSESPVVLLILIFLTLQTLEAWVCCFL